MTVEVIGGIGLFLLGMMLLTEGLQAAFSSTLSAALTRVTASPLRATFAGATVTALLQSSSATTLATIGFVSAGLLTFQQALGVIVGANVGTTSTGWLVSLIGLKVQISAFALPLVAAGALLRMLATGRMRHSGVALAGFGLIFLGIDVLQSGMAEVAERIDLSGVAGTSLLDQLILVGIGIGMTFVMQSSSAAVATTLAAVYSGAIGLPAAAALAIGQNVGTTITAGIASIGGTVPARRTAVAHVMFNICTGAIAFMLLPLVPRVAASVGLDEDPAVALAAFHTSFNLLGVVLVLPFLRQFAELVTRIVPDRDPSLVRYLDVTVASVPAVAVQAARKTALAATGVSFEAASELLTDGKASRIERARDARLALGQTRSFLGTVSSPAGNDETYDQRLSVLHAIDHGERLADAILDVRHLEVVRREPELRGLADELFASLGDAAEWCQRVTSEERTAADGSDPSPREELAQRSDALARRRREYRATILEETAKGLRSPDAAVKNLDAMIWIDRVGYHSWRCMHHLAAVPEPLASDIGSHPAGE